MNQLELEETPCPLCERGEQAEAYRFPPYGVVRCRACGFHYLSPRPTDRALQQLYEQQGYYAGEAKGYSNYTDQEAALRATFRRVLRHLQRLDVTGGDLLEIGCAYGYFLEEAVPFFARRVGTEWSAEGVMQASSRADAVYRGGIEAIPEGMTFDCIVAIHVIEHVTNPKPFLERLRSHLRPGGRLVLAAPNMGSLWRQAMGTRWPSFKIPEHVLYFDRISLSALMRQTGLTDVRVLPYWHAFPLTLIAEKLRVGLPAACRRVNVWLPGTTVAAVGGKRHHE